MVELVFGESDVIMWSTASPPRKSHTYYSAWDIHNFLVLASAYVLGELRATITTYGKT